MPEPIVDPLTGLLNRTALARRLEEIEAQSPIIRAPVALLHAAVDQLSQLDHGHANDVLVEVARRLRGDLRTFDLVYRVGEHELLVALPGVALGEGAAIAERLRKAVGCWPIGDLWVTLSVGVAATSGEVFEGETMLAAAEAALGEARGSGGDRIVGARAVPVSG